MEFKRVVVTGLGTISPLGHNVQDTWEAMQSGKSAAAPITRFDASKFKTKFACEVKDYDPKAYFDRKEVRKLDLYSQFAMISAEEAIKHSGLDLESVDLDRIGVIWGSGIGGLETFISEISGYAKGDGTPRFSPFFIPKMIADIAAGHISIKYGLKGPNFSTVSACASAAHALSDAFNLIRLGKANVFVTGGSEAAINEAGIGGFNAMHAISTRNDEPEIASRPFDKDRDGFVLGEGGGALIFEEREHALKRGATIYAEVVGAGLSADASHMTSPHPQGEGAVRAMKEALRDAGIESHLIDHVNTHGTSTPLGDVAEPRAIVELFGEHAYKLSINSTKSMSGHLLGAAGAIEAIATIKAIQESFVPPTINLDNLDSDIDESLDFTRGKGKKQDITYGLSNTFGFGGHNASLIFKKYKE
ncbi:MAG: beta-ketoacyl-ACP synthase II [Bacteroidales bacterium]|nr:beta-ketoacyl-ACP synthase II [Bacteroidales bacterium]MCF8328316.1 beta-ketoacyl-ACP synthase II [Bacteroidales bacterium]